MAIASFSVDGEPCSSASSHVDAEQRKAENLSKAMGELHVGGMPENEAAAERPTNNASTSTINPALVDAMRNARDREFVSRHEREMEVRIQDDSVTQWDIPLMNSYQRLLVHRLADHFQLDHSIDPATKKVSLRKQDSTHIPEHNVATLADQERLSEPASNSLSSLLAGRSGTSTPSSVVSAPGVPLSVRIMRREDLMGESSGTSSPRSGQRISTPDGAVGRKDRRNMTIEEREEAYRQARQRIFGSESDADEVRKHASVSVSGDSDAESSMNAAAARCQSRDGVNTTAPVTVSRLSEASSASSSASSQVKQDERFGEDAISPQQLQYAPYPTVDSGAYGMRSAPPSAYPFPAAVDFQYQSQYYPAGQWSQAPPAAGVAFDVYGRPYYPAPLYAHCPPYVPLMSAGQSQADFAVRSPSESSRSTSVSAGPDGTESRQSSISEQRNGSQSSSGQQSSLSPGATHGNGTGYSAPVSRSNSTSPSVPYPRLSPSFSGASTPGMAGGHPSAAGVWPMYPQPAPPAFMEHQSSPSWSSGARQGGNAASSSRAWQLPPQGVAGQPFRAPPGQTYLPDPNGYAAAVNGRPKATRGRRSQGSERSLYDPNRPDGSLPTSSGDPSAGTNGGSDRHEVRAASVSSASSARTSEGGTAMRPFHSSLPARPDWAVSTRASQTASAGDAVSKSEPVSIAETTASPGA